VIGLIYQLIKLTIDYTEYETVMDLRAEPSFENYIAITLCDRSKFRLKNKFFEKPSFYDLSCWITRPYQTVSCGDLCPLYGGSTRFSNHCITFLNCKYEFQPEGAKVFRIENNKDLILLFHNYNIPPQFITIYHKIKLNYSFTFEYQTMEEILLPLPYESDCYDYEHNKELFSPKSKEDCILNYLKQKEYKKCKFNREWLYEKYEFLSNKTRYETHNCSIQYNKDELNRICKKDCKKKWYTLSVKQNSENYRNESRLYIQPSSRYIIKVTHLPKMDLITYLCSIGSLSGMWIGISIYSTLSYLKQLFDKFAGKFTIFRHFSNCLRIMNFRKFRKIMAYNRKSIIIICIVLMLFQIFGVIKNYLEYDIITRIEMKTHFKIPKMSIAPEPNDLRYDLIHRKLLGIYPDYLAQCKYLFEMAKNVSDQGNIEISYTGLINYYVLKYLSEHSIQEFADSIINPEEIAHSCYFVIKQRKINCPKPVYFFTILDLNHLSVNQLLFSEINETETSQLINIGIEKHIEKIVIELNIDFDIVLEIFQSRFAGTKSIVIETNAINNLFYSSNILHKTSSYKEYCQNNLEGIFGNSSYDNNIISCFLENLNKTHSCLPLISSLLFVRIEYDLKIIGYKLCSTEIMGNLSQIERILQKCFESFDPECNVELFETELKSIEFKGKLNRTILNIIPKVSVKPQYSESLKTDLNELIYNCGGIMGLWFGLSAVSITYGTIIFFFIKLPKHIKTSFVFLKHHLKRLFDSVSFTTIRDLFIRIFSSILYFIRYSLNTLKILFKQTFLISLKFFQFIFNRVRNLFIRVIKFNLKFIHFFFYHFKILFKKFISIFFELILYLLYIVSIKIILLYRAIVNKLRFAVRVRPHILF
jgi:hypothetical protein